MDTGANMDDAQQEAALTERINLLEAELKTARASLEALRARALVTAPPGGAWSGAVPATMPHPFSALPNSNMASAKADGKGMPLIMLEPLPMHDVLRKKWNLGAGVPLPREGEGEETPGLPKRADGYLRLFGLLSDGESWEASIPFAELAQPGGLTLGREAMKCDIVLPEGSVSRKHARLGLAENGLFVADCGSTNGVYVNEERISPYAPYAPLTDGMTLGFGETVLRVEVIQNPMR